MTLLESIKCAFVWTMKLFAMCVIACGVFAAIVYTMLYYNPLISILILFLVIFVIATITLFYENE